ncbi:MAG: DUF2723 domain-containing protein [Bacteroidetes bacterium]|nr:DUF2723 domain-containing protein [Bacteroidota bacterium]
MNNFRLLNRIFGWVTFVIALAVYTLTLEPSVSLWDCGEFASAAYRLQVVHPPGAPFFLMIGRLFSLIAGSPAEVGFWINMLSAVASAGCVMFTFWITTHFAQKIVSAESENRNVLIFGAGLVAALSNTFLDTFWFSAVEAEVYAMSSFFTALTFWAILRWDKHSEDPASDRWLVFIAFITGLALGTHMLNLLVIPAICLAYYFKRFTITRKGVFLAFGTAIVALGFVMKIIYPGIPWLVATMDRVFVNGFHMPFYSGSIFALVLIFGSIGYFLYLTHKKKLRNWNITLLSVLFVIIGYSSYAMVVIRSYANPAIDMNNPEDPYKFYGYITRQQYQDRPLVKGPYFNAPGPYSFDDKGTKYYKGENKYEDGGKIQEPVYDPDYNVLFPRMGKSGKSGDARGYRQFSGMGDIQAQIDELRELQSRGKLSPMQQQELQDLELEMPSFFKNNMMFFFNYQIRYMYIRYFLWNFVGRFNDQQAVTGNERFDGNWYSGIPVVDRFVTGPKSGLPDYYKNQKGKNGYFFLPLILGIMGMIIHYKRAKLDAWLVMTLFLFTGVLINVYMNQPPYEPRERDYSQVGSFQTFCIWVGLGVILVADLIKKYFKKNAAIAATLACIVAVPVNMGYQNWDDHDRSGRYIGIDLAKDFLGSLEPNAILFCNGDNDTYPLWYAQNVEGFRTDVRIINESLLPTEWYSSILLDTVYKSTPLPLTVTKKDLRTGSFEYGIEVDRGGYKKPRPFRNVIQELLRDNSNGAERNFWHGAKCYIKVDKEVVKKAGLVSPKDYGQIVDSIDISIGGDYLSKGDLVVYDLITTNAEQGWKRPIYFTSVSGYDFNYLNPYLQLEGLVYRFVPIRGGVSGGNQPTKISDIHLYNNLVNNYSYYGMNKKKNFYLDDKAAYVPQDMQQYGLMLGYYYQNEIRQYEGVKKALDSGKIVAPPPGFADINGYVSFYKDSIDVYKKRIVTVLNKILTEIPESVMPMRRDMKTEYAMLLVEFGDDKNGKKLLDMAMNDNIQYYKYFLRYQDEFRWGSIEVGNSQALINQIISFCNQKGKKDWANQYKQMSPI